MIQVTERVALADGTVDQVARLMRDHADLDILVRHVLEQASKIHLLHVVASEGHTHLLADDSHHRPMIEFGIVEPVQEMDGAGTRGRKAHTHFTGELGVPAGHERRHLLMPYLNKIELIPRSTQRTHDAVDTIAGVAEDALHAPFAQAAQ